MNPCILETPGGSRRELTKREARILRLKPPQERPAMSRKPRSVTIRLCTLDRTTGLALWGILASIAGWALIEVIALGKSQARTDERLVRIEATTNQRLDRIESILAGKEITR